MTHDIAWATGVFEGEGYITIHPRYKSVRIGMSQSDLDILKRLQTIFGGSVAPKTDNTKPSHYKPMWMWRVGDATSVKNILSQMLPLLGHRRACKALDALDRLDGC